MKSVNLNSLNHAGEKARQEQDVQSYQARLRALSVRLADVRENERNKLSRDLHDQVGHELGLARFKLSAVIRGKEIDLPEGLAKQLSDIETHLKQAIRQTRTLGYEYHPQVLSDAGLIPALQWLAESYREQHHIQVSLCIEEESDPFHSDRNLRGRLFAAVQECVYNAWKYAEVDEIRICARSTSRGQFEITVEDDGKGFDLQQLEQPDFSQGGFGLFSIREMLEYEGGSFSCESSPGHGTRIHMTIPLQGKTKENQE